MENTTSSTSIFLECLELFHLTEWADLHSSALNIIQTVWMLMRKQTHTLTLSRIHFHDTINRDKTLYIKEIYCDLAHIFFPFVLLFSFFFSRINLLILLLCYVYKYITLFSAVSIIHSFSFHLSLPPIVRSVPCHYECSHGWYALCTDCLTGASTQWVIEYTCNVPNFSHI